MKHINTVLTIIAVLLLPLIAAAAENNPWERKLPFESATIQYTLSGTENPASKSRGPRAPKLWERSEGITWNAGKRSQPSHFFPTL